MPDQVGVQRVVAGDQDGRRRPAAAPGPARLLPQRRPGARPSGDQHGVQAGDVDPELERGGGGQPDQPPVGQGRLQPAPVLGQVAGAVRRHLRLGGPPPGCPPLGGPPLGWRRRLQRPARGQRDRLGAAPGPDEGQRLDVLLDQPAEQVSRLGGGGSAQPGARLAAGLGQRRFPQGEGQRPARRAVLGHLLGAQPGQHPGAGARRPDRGGGEHEDRARRPVRRGVVRHHPAQPPQHVGHVRAEHSPVAVAFVDHHQAQPTEEPRPALMPGQQGPVQHVRGGQQVPGVAARPGPLGVGRVAVEGGRLHAGQAERADRRELIGGEGLGRRDVEHSVAGEHRGEGGQQVAERFAGRRGGGDDHVPAGLGVVRGEGLVTPRSADAAGCEGSDDLRRNPPGPWHFPAGPGRDVLHVDRAARPRVIEQDAERAVLRPGAGRERHRSGWGKGDESRHSPFSVTSCPAILGDFPCVAPLGGAREHDFV